MVIPQLKKSTDNRDNFRLLGSFYAQIDFGNIWEGLQGLQWKTQFGPDFRYYRNGNFLDSSSISRAGGNNTVSRGDGRTIAWTLDNMLLYNKSIKEHTFGIPSKCRRLKQGNRTKILLRAPGRCPLL